MYRVMIVDDEPLMRKYLSSRIPAFDGRFEVINVSKDGQEAIDFLNNAPEETDVIITDIKMPEVDGLNLAKYVRDRFPSIIVIIISGFSEFEYARKAIQYNVSDYLVKPLKDQNLKDVLDTVALRLNKSGHKSMFHASGKSAPGYGSRHELVQAILDEDTTKIYRSYEQISGQGTKIMKAAGCIVQCRLLYVAKNSTGGAAVESSFFAFNILANDICSKMGYISLYGENGDTYILIDGKSPSEIETRVDFLYQKIRDARPPGPFDLYCGKAVTDIMLLSQSLKSIWDFQLLAISSEENIFFYPAMWHQSEALQRIDNLCKQIQTDISSEDLEGLRADCRYLCENNIAPSPAGLWRAGEYLIEQTLETHEIDGQKIAEAYQTLSNACLSRTNIQSDSISFTDSLFQTLVTLLRFEVNKPLQEMPVIRKAKEYIVENYQNNISLLDVASHCGVSGSYLSGIFQKQMGIPYSKYLTQLRMEQAAKLLKNYPDMKVYEVATSSGFISAKHFISVFKKYYGISPLNFQKNARNEG